MTELLGRLRTQTCLSRSTEDMQISFMLICDYQKIAMLIKAENGLLL